MYLGYDMAFRTEEDFRQFLKDYEGTVFKGNREKQIVLWCFRHENRFLPQHEWDKIDAPAMERRLNFYPGQVKQVKDPGYTEVSEGSYTVYNKKGLKNFAKHQHHPDRRHHSHWGMDADRKL